MSRRVPPPARGKSPTAKIDRAYRALHKAIVAERRAVEKLQHARANYFALFHGELSRKVQA